MEYTQASKMKKVKLSTSYRKLLADTLTPVSIYLKLRDKFANSILLESSDYHGNDNTFSYICFQPIASFELRAGQISVQLPGLESNIEKTVREENEVVAALTEFIDTFDVEPDTFNFPQNGLFGYTCYDSVRYFEDLDIQDYSDASYQIPDMLYQVYQYIIAIDHFKNELYLFCHDYEGPTSSRKLDEIVDIINNLNIPAYGFQLLESETSNLQDEAYKGLVQKGIQHCQRGDVFQIVLSRQFSQKFLGDDFNVYRSLRSVNPSPYLFYFDYGNFKIFGSSPEAQLRIQNNIAEIHPIAGTFRRTGDDQEDARLAQELNKDEKENAEHVMLVDLARNDLSMSGHNVSVETYKEIQYYSHLIHLVSKVTAEVSEGKSSLQLYSDTFPAGTLSGAPKYRAMELINEYENQNRGYYGGAIGFLSFQGDLNHAIMIRSFLSKNNKLFFQAGAGIVAKSDPQKELEEVSHKLGALRAALKRAEEVNNTIESSQ